MTIEENYEFWTNNPYFDKETKEELLKIKNEEEIKDRFYKNLVFGTGGIRALMGAGTNRLNIYTIRKITQGLANYINNLKTDKKDVVISYDSRNNSYRFAKEAALCLNANGIKTYIFDKLKPTPLLSFAVTYLNCITGIMITASHNPKEYNGYKLYNEYGYQIVGSEEKNIITEINKIENFDSVNTIDLKEAQKKGLYNILTDEVENEFLKNIKKIPISLKDIKNNDLKIVYTPLNGAGNLLVNKALKEVGFNKVYTVEEQKNPDGNFPTLKYPNPEEDGTFDLAIKLANKKDADIILATDPDADRIGVYAKNYKTNEYEKFTGNMIGSIILEYKLSKLKEKNKIPKNGAIIKTIVTTNLAKLIAKNYNIKCFDVLTGFKYIGEKIALWNKNKKYTYLFGFEESYGCLLDTYAKDKDSIGAAVIICEIAAYCKNNGLSLTDYLNNIYIKYGYFLEGAKSITMEGLDGQEKIKNILDSIGQNPPSNFGNLDVLNFYDYNKQIKLDLKNNTTKKTTLPKTNALYFELSDNCWFCVRPSGTEPKIKFYMGVNGINKQKAQEQLENLQNEIIKFL